MYNVLIADDEPAIVNGLQYVINWEEHGLQLADGVKNGAEALMVLKSRKIDILITDIRMPEMDGLALIREIRMLELDIKIIILSGYGEFGYAREAARLGIENYLLKPVAEGELSATLQSTVEKLEAEEYTRNESSKGFEILKETILNRWIMGSISQSEFTQRAQMLGIHPDAGNNLICLVQAVRTVEACDTKNGGNCQGWIHRVCRELVSKVDGGYVFQNFNGDTVILFLWNDNKLSYDAVRSVLQECLGQMNTTETPHACAYLGMAGSDWNCVPANYKRLLSLSALPANGQPGSIVELASYLSSTPGDAIPKWSTENYSSLVKKTVQYIHDHYADEISLKTISCTFNVNPAYLGRQFSRETGQMFTGYLNNLRIKYAKTMLLETDGTGREIGMRVGYSNQNYFYNTFKRVTGMYPAEYRSLNK